MPQSSTRAVRWSRSIRDGARHVTSITWIGMIRDASDSDEQPNRAVRPKCAARLREHEHA